MTILHHKISSVGLRKAIKSAFAEETFKLPDYRGMFLKAIAGTPTFTPPIITDDAVYDVVGMHDALLYAVRGVSHTPEIYNEHTVHGAHHNGPVYESDKPMLWDADKAFISIGGEKIKPMSSPSFAFKSCEHDPVNVGFMTVKNVCKKCGVDL